MPWKARAIDTEYNGYRFRSRLEARHALFYDTLSIPYRYEVEGFDLDGLNYLPDFWLPTREVWVEVKPEKPTEQEEEKARRLARLTELPVYIAWGEVGVPDICSGTAYKYYPDGQWNICYVWTECPVCGGLSLCCEGVVIHLPCDGCGRGLYTDEKGEVRLAFGYDTPRLRRAYRVARQARFEQYPRNIRARLEDAGLI